MSVRVYPETFKKRVVSAWLKQTGPMAAFARKMGVSDTAVNAWVRDYQSGKLTLDSTPETPAFVELAVQNPPIQQPQNLTTCSLQVADSLVLFSSLPPPDWFAALLRGIKSC